MSDNNWQERNDNEPGEIYAIIINGVRQESTNKYMVKIGLSRNARKRLEQLQSSQPCGELKFYTTPVRVERMLDCEQYLHNKYANQNVRFKGSIEWFAFNKSQLRSISKDFKNLSNFQYKIYRRKEKGYKSMPKPKLQRISFRSIPNFPNNPAPVRFNPVLVVCGIFTALILAAIF